MNGAFRTQSSSPSPRDCVGSGADRAEEAKQLCPGTAEPKVRDQWPVGAAATHQALSRSDRNTAPIKSVGGFWSARVQNRISGSRSIFNIRGNGHLGWKEGTPRCSRSNPRDLQALKARAGRGQAPAGKGREGRVRRLKQKSEATISAQSDRVDEARRFLAGPPSQPRRRSGARGKRPGQQSGRQAQVNTRIRGKSQITGYTKCPVAPFDRHRQGARIWFSG